MCVCVCFAFMYVYIFCVCLAIRAPRTGFITGYELTTWLLRLSRVLWNSSKYSYLLGNLSPALTFFLKDKILS